MVDVGVRQSASLMNGTLIGILILVVALIVGPFATLRAVSHYRARRANTKARDEKQAPKAPDDEDPNDKGSYW